MTSTNQSPASVAAAVTDEDKKQAIKNTIKIVTVHVVLPIALTAASIIIAKRMEKNS